jgi:GH15 family glucan-1,4-alpha-glucosidase
LSVEQGLELRNWQSWLAALEYVERVWHEPDEGIWEVRGPRRHFTHSKVMAWVVFDRSIKIAEQLELEAPLERWRQIRAEIHAEVCERGWDPERRTFTQYYGSEELDSAALVLALVGFLPPGDERMVSTIDAVELELARDGLLSRYSTGHTDDGLAGDEGQFLACSFWLVAARALTGRLDEARALYERLIGLTNDLGLLSEEYDVKRQRQVGNFPQAFSHLAIINAARIIERVEQALPKEPQHA